MAGCLYCSTTILFGGTTDKAGRFCGERCLQSYYLLQRAQSVPYRMVQQKMLAMHQGRCPMCGGRGPVDVHRAYRVASGLFVTKWTNIPKVCCRKCGRKSQLAAIGYCLALGWWGLPWGILVTPLQMARNLKAMLGGPRRSKPSAELERLVRVGLATRIAAGKLPDPRAHKPPSPSNSPPPAAAAKNPTGA